MKKLLAALTILLFSAPALADHMPLMNGKNYTDPVVSCSTADSAIKYIVDLKHVVTEQFTKDSIITAATNNNCVYQLQHFTYIEKEYVCSFSVLYRSFTLLDTEIEGIEQFIVVFARANNMFKPCLKVEEMEKLIE